MTDWQAIIVLGARVRPDATPSAALRRRVEGGCALWHAGLAPTLVLSGGVSGGPVSEAVVAAGLARELGVPTTALQIEAESRSTRENAAFCVSLLNGVQRVVVVTDDFHLRRAELHFRRVFTEVRGVGLPSGRPRGRDLLELPLLVRDLLWR